MKAKALSNNPTSAKAALTIIFILMVIASVFMCAGPVKAQVVMEGLVSYWTFDESDIDGETVTDVWGDNDGTIVGDPEIAEGKIGDALKFDGTNDYVDCGDDASLDFGQGEFTVGTWFRTTGAGMQRILNSGHYGWTDGYVFGTGWWVPGAVTLGVGAGGVDANGTLPHTLSAFNDDEWHYAVGVYKYGDYIAIYVDGVLQSIGQGTCGTVADNKLDISNCPNLNADHTTNTLIGRYTNGPESFGGVVDEVCIYNRALGQGEIEQNFAARKFSAAVNPTEKLAVTWGETKVSR